MMARSPRYTLTGSAQNCSKHSRVVRGGVGLLIGAVLGGMIGGGVALAVNTTQFEFTAPIEAFKRAKRMTMIAAGIAVVSATGGLLIASHAPECSPSGKG